jgi:hypothetical protein
MGCESGRQDSNLRRLVPQTSTHFPIRIEFELELFRREMVGKTTHPRTLKLLELRCNGAYPEAIQSSTAPRSPAVPRSSTAPDVERSCTPRAQRAGSDKGLVDDRKLGDASEAHSREYRS